MQISSCLAGIAISTTKTALAHSISYAFTTNYKVPHGLACSFTLPEILLFNSKKDDGRLLNLAKNLGFENSLFLYKKFNQFLEDLNIYEILRNILPPDFNEIKDINDQMFNKGRISNNLRLVELEDVNYMRALEDGNTAKAKEIADKKKVLRDLPADTKIDSAKDMDELKKTWNENMLGKSPYK